MSTGFVPFPIRNVKPFVVVVQEGDSVSKIAHGMTGDASRWTELVGANPQKELSSGNVAGSPYRVFASLQPGEKLMVPASWPDPGHVGDLQIQNKGSSYINQASKTTCAPKTCADIPGACGTNWDGCKETIDCGPCVAQAGSLDPYGQLISTILGSYPGLPQPPAPYTMPNVSDVIASWYPYLQVIYPTTFPKTPAIPDADGASQWAKLIESAIAFLVKGDIPPDLVANIVKNIPWDQIPWDKIPWQELADKVLKQVWGSDFWKILISSTTVSPGAPSMAGSTGSTVNFLDKTIWSNATFTGVKAFGWQNFSKSIVGPDPVTVWGKLNDPELIACITSNPTRAQQLVQYNVQCGFDKDLAKLKQYMCDPSLDISKCTAAPGPTPGLPTGVDWACAPAPQCIADQFKTLGFPAPCDPMPTCIPEWYKTITGQNLPKESEKESNTPLYLGLTAAGIALVAGVLVIAASD